MKTTLLLLGAIATIPPSDPPVEADQLGRLLLGTQAEIRDVSLVYEGKSEYPGLPDLTSEEREARVKKYQGIFRYRNDGATFMDIYIRREEMSSVFRMKGSILRGKIEQMDLSPDSQRKPRLRSGPGTPGRLNFPSSFYRIGSCRADGGGALYSRRRTG